MRNRNNPLKNFTTGAFTIIQASHTQFHKYLTDIPTRYPEGRITYINNHQFVPLIQFSEEHQDRLDHLVIHTLEELLQTIESDTSAILFIEHKIVWFGVDNQERLIRFNDVCKKRAKSGGPVVVITAIMDRELLELDGKADYFIQVGKIESLNPKRRIKDQTSLDEIIPLVPPLTEKKRLYGQMILGDWCLCLKSNR